MQLSKVVHAVKVPFSVTTPAGVVMDRFVYVYLIYGGNGICLIDTGVANAEEAIFDYVRATGRRVSDIYLVVQTHSHPDHIGATRTIKGETGCAVAVHPSERAWVEDVGLQGRERPVPGFETLVAGSLAVDRTLDTDGEIIDLGCGLKLQVFHTPGHSKGSVSILLLGYMALFSGDAVPVPGDMPVYEDALASVASINKLKGIRGIRHFLPSWDEPRQGDEAYQRMDAGLEYLQRVHDAVLGCAGETSGAEEPLAMPRCVLKRLEIPPVAATPLVAKSFASHLAAHDRRTIV